jgi:small nuclear ribonucleoprotein (snRNP)-like protein
VLTCDGRLLVGILVGHDQVQNLILNEAQERIYSEDEDVEIVPLGLYVVRGDNVVLVWKLIGRRTMIFEQNQSTCPTTYNITLNALQKQRNLVTYSCRGEGSKSAKNTGTNTDMSRTVPAQLHQCALSLIAKKIL